MGPGRKPYKKGTVDFFAVWVIPLGEWYIIPYAAMGKKMTLHFTAGVSERSGHGIGRLGICWRWWRFRLVSIRCMKRRRWRVGWSEVGVVDRVSKSHSNVAKYATLEWGTLDVILCFLLLARSISVVEE